MDVRRAFFEAYRLGRRRHDLIENYVEQRPGVPRLFNAAIADTSAALNDPGTRRPAPRSEGEY